MFPPKTTKPVLPEPDPHAPLWVKVFRWLRRYWIPLFVFFLSLVGLGFSKGDALYREAKRWRVEQLIRSARKAQQTGDEVGAKAILRQAWVLLPQHVPTIRAMAEHEAWKRDPSALEAYQRLVATGGATVDDWIQFTREAFRQQRVSDGSLWNGVTEGDFFQRDISRLQFGPAALRGLQELGKIPGTAERPEVVELEAERKLWEGKAPAALALARQAVASATAEARESAQLAVARILLSPSASLPTQRAEGITILDGLALRPGRNGLEALEILIHQAQRPSAAAFFAGHDAEKWRQAVTRHPQANESLRAKAWNLRLVAEPGQTAAIVQEMCRYYATAAPNQKLEGARWLNQHGFYAECIDLVEPSKLVSRPWFLVYLDALAGAQQWEKVAPLVDAKADVPLSPAVRRLFAFRAATELRKNPDASEAWREIRRLLQEESYENGLFIATYAEKTGYPPEAATIYRRMLGATLGLADLSNPKQQRLACHLGLIRTGSAAMRLDELEKALAEFANDFSALADVENDLAYVRLLSGSEPDKAQEAAGRLIRLRPELLAYRTTAALAALKRGDPDAALQTYAGWKIDWATAPDRFKAVYAGVLAASGREEQTAAIRRLIRAEVLRREERILAGLPTQ